MPKNTEVFKHDRREEIITPLYQRAYVRGYHDTYDTVLSAIKATTTGMAGVIGCIKRTIDSYEILKRYSDDAGSYEKAFFFLGQADGLRDYLGEYL